MNGIVFAPKNHVSYTAIVSFMVVAWSSCALATPITTGVAAVPAAMTSHDLAGHKATYKIQMTSSKMGAPVIGVRGKMTYTAKPSCEGWIIRHQFNLNYDYTNNPSSQVETKFASFESYDGAQFQFSSTRHTNGELSDELRGRGALAASSASGAKEAIGKAVYSIPEDVSYDLSQGTLFPVTHTALLVQSAMSGQHIINAHVFDGSDDTGPVEINALIGKVQKAAKGEAPKAIDGDLVNVDSWPVRMAVFADNKDQAEAEYELTMTLLQNGIIKDMTVDYHDFSIAQTLVGLEKVSAEKCGE